MVDLDSIIRRFENITYRLKNIQENSCCTKSFLMDTLSLAEVSAINLRDIYFCIENKNCYYEHFAKNINISVNYIEEKEMYKITLPRLLCKTKNTLNGFIFDPIYYLLLYAERNNKLKKFDKATFCFVHNCSEENIIPDYDNLETKRIIDLLTSFFIPDDNGKYFTQMNLTRTSNKNTTEIYVFDSSYTNNIIFNSLYEQ